ncbi:MAG: GntR family transcriptional regulator [Pseudorhizobium sp.]
MNERPGDLVTTSHYGRAPRLNEQITSELERHILSGSLQRGLRLVEAAIAEQFGVSRAPVRGAFRRLEQKGLIVRDSTGGFSVSHRASTPSNDQPVRLDPIHSAATWEAIYAEVSREAVSHAAFGAWRLIETDLAESYQVSRTVIREVLARLEHVGIVRKEDGYRWLLPELSPVRIRELYDMRRVLEPVALAEAADNAPPDLLVEMREELEAARDGSDMISPDEFGRLERRLHVGLLSFARNQTLISTLQRFHALLVTNAHLYDTTRSVFGPDPFVQEHLDIVTALERGNVSTACKLLQVHMDHALPRALDRIEHMVRDSAVETLPYLKPLGKSRHAGPNALI